MSARWRWEWSSSIHAARTAYPRLATLLNVGGERFSLATFDEDGHYLSCTTNTSCAAGTGSFLDQQEGYQLNEISSGLCQGLAKNIADTLFAGRHLPRGRVVFCGGVAKNQAVVNALAELTVLKFTVPDNGPMANQHCPECLQGLDATAERCHKSIRDRLTPFPPRRLHELSRRTLS